MASGCEIRDHVPGDVAKNRGQLRRPAATGEVRRIREDAKRCALVVDGEGCRLIRGLHCHSNVGVPGSQREGRNAVQLFEVVAGRRLRPLAQG